MVNINIKFQKKDLWLLSAIVVFLIGVGFVVAFGGNNPAVMGHSLNEIEKCSANQTLKADANGDWACANAVSGGLPQQIICERCADGETNGNPSIAQTWCTNHQPSGKTCYLEFYQDFGGTDRIWCLCWNN